MKPTESLKELLGFKLDFNYSSMGQLRQRVEYKGNEVHWGLNELGNSPILCYPRPKIEFKAKNGYGGKYLANVPEGQITVFNEQFDFVMHRCIEQHKPEDIIEAMFDRSITLTID